jgi:alanine racemase
VDADPRATCLVDPAMITSNVAVLVERAAPAAVCAVVKADGYGHGLLTAAHAALAGGAAWLGVAFVDEALALRAGGVTAPVLAFLTCPGDDLAAAVRAGVDLAAGSTGQLAAVTAAATTVGRPARVHLEADTGLGRGGAPAGSAAAADPATSWAGLIGAAAAAAAAGLVEVAGVWSHLACADQPDHPVTAAQVQAFGSALDVAARAGLRPELRHLANSAALLSAPQTHFDLARAGIATYGLSPGAVAPDPAALGLHPAMTLTARVALAKRLPAGHGLSYGHCYRTSAETTVVVVPLGYADGVPRSAGGVAEVLAAGLRHRIAGRVCMDQFLLDVGDAPVREGDEVVLFGPADRGEPTADDWAASLGTIGYEIVTRVGARVPRRTVAARTAARGSVA